MNVGISNNRINTYDPQGIGAIVLCRMRMSAAPAEGIALGDLVDGSNLRATMLATFDNATSNADVGSPLDADEASYPTLSGEWQALCASFEPHPAGRADGSEFDNWIGLFMRVS